MSDQPVSVSDHNQACFVAEAADRMVGHAKTHPGKSPNVPQVGRPPYSAKDRFKLAVYCARENYWLSITQKNPYWSGYYMAKAEHMQDVAIGIAMEQGALFSEILPTVEFVPGQFAEATEL